MPALDLDDVVSLGGWDARYAKPLVADTYGDRAAALIDSNGDGGALELDVYRWVDGAWQAGPSGSAGGGTYWVDGLLISAGGAHPHERVHVLHDGQELGVTAASSGWWMVLTLSNDPGRDR